MKIKKKLQALFMAILIAVIVFTSSQPASAQRAAALSITGWFSIIWGDGPAGSPVLEPVYTITEGNGITTKLLMDDSLAVSQSGVLVLNRQLVTVQGVQAYSLPGQNGQGFNVNDAIQVSSITLEKPQGVQGANGVEALVNGSRPFVSIMCKFQGDAAEPRAKPYFQNMYGSAYPGLDHYWREVSYDNVNVAGSNAYGWYVLPRTRAGYNKPGGASFDLYLAATDCTAAANADINFANYSGGINLMFNNDLDGYAWGGGYYMTLDRISKVWPMTWEPPWGYTAITVIAHEMGHAFGLPHSSGAYGATYDNQWDVMSDTWTNCGRSSNATYGCLGQHTISAHKDFLGWIPAGQKFTAGQNTNTAITLEQLALPTNGNFKMVQIPINGSSTHYYTVEVRRQTGYDVKLPGQAVIIHEVDLYRSRPAWVVDADGNGNTGDAGAMWTVGEVFRDAANQISVSVVYSTSMGFSVHITSGQNIFYISGNIGLAGEPVSYTGGSTVTDGNGYYSIIVPPNWNGTVTPSSSCYTFTPLNHNYTNISSDLIAQNYTPSAPNPVCADVDVPIAGVIKGNYILPPTGSTRANYTGVDSGPVKVVSTNGVPIITSERVLYKVNGVDTSYSEMMGVPASLVNTTYWFPWYNNATLDTQLRLANVSGSTATVQVYIGDVRVSPLAGITITAGQSTRVSYAGVNNGPLEVISDVAIVASERVLYKVNGVDTSFTEMMGLPASQVNTTFWFPWYNNVTLDTQLRLANVSGAAASVQVFVGGVEVPDSPFSLTATGAGQSKRVSFAGVNDGPVEVVSDQVIVASERVLYNVNGIDTSYSEMLGLPAGQLTTTYWMPWYNNATLDTQFRLANVSGAAATVHVYVGGAEMTGSPFSLTAGGAGQSTRVSFAGVNNGPLQVVSDVAIVASERVLYKVNGVDTSYSEMIGLPNSQLSTTYWMPWYNNVTLDTQLRFAVP